MPFIKERFSSSRLLLRRLNGLIRLLLGLMLFIAPAGASASSSPCPALGPAEIDYATLEPGMEEPDDSLPQIQTWTRSDRSTIDLNFTSKKIWVRIRWNNPSTAGASCVLEINYPFLDSVAFLVRRSEGWRILSAGDREFKGGSLPYTRYPAFRFESLPGMNEVYLRIASQGLVRVPLKMGEFVEAQGPMTVDLIIAALLAGGLILIIIYSLSLAAAYQDASILYYVLFQCTILFKVSVDLGLMRILLSDSWFILLNNHGYIIDGHLGPLSGAIFTISFLELRTRSRILYGMALVTCSLSALGILMTPISYKASAFLGIVGVLASGILFTGAGITMLVKKFRPARFFAMGWFVMVAAALIWSLTNLGIIPYSEFNEWGVAIGAIIEAGLTSLALGDKMKYNLLLEKKLVQKLNIELNQFNANLEAEVERKTRQIRSIMTYIKQGIFTIDGRAAIGSDYSLHLESIMGRSNLENMPVIDALQGIAIPSETLNTIQAALSMILNEPAIAYDLNKSNLCGEVRLGDGRVLEFDWHSMLNAENCVEQLLVSIRDVTEIKRLTLESDAHSYEMKIAAKIMDIKDDVFQQFSQEARGLLEECAAVLSSSIVPDPADHRRALINLHTVKGLARSLRFEEISQAAHEAERILQSEGSASPVPPEARDSIQGLLDLVKHYTRIAEERLGRKLDTRNLQIPVEKIHDWLMTWSSGKAFRELLQISTQSLHELFRSMDQDAAQLARDLGKDAPELLVSGHDAQIDRQVAVKLKRVLIHVLRNALDHGLESPEERERQGKPKRGIMSLETKVEQESILLRITDDGRGLNLQRIREKALESHPGLALEKPSETTVASWIFQAGVTTAASVSLISGRGVGMSAVKHFIECMQGSVTIDLGEPGPTGFHRFALVIGLPVPAIGREQLAQLHDLAA